MENEKPTVGDKKVKTDEKPVTEKKTADHQASDKKGAANVTVTKPEVASSSGLEIDNADIDQSSTKKRDRLELSPSNPEYSSKPSKSSKPFDSRIVKKQ